MASTSYSGVSVGYRSGSSNQACAIGNDAVANGGASIAIGQSAVTNEANTRQGSAIAIGYQADAEGVSSIAIGSNAKVDTTYGTSSIAIGNGSTVVGDGCIALGSLVQISDRGVGVIKVGMGSTLSLYFFAPFSTLAQTYTENNPGIGFVCDGFSGCKKLSELLTDPFITS